MNTNTAAAITALAALFTANGMDANTANNLAALNVDLETRLANGAVTFTFTKKDGTTRTAVGTNKPTIVPNFYTFKGSTARANNAVLALMPMRLASSVVKSPLNTTKCWR